MKKIRELILSGQIKSFKLIEDCSRSGQSEFYMMPIDYTPREFEYVDYIYNFPEDNDRLFRDIRAKKTFTHSFGDYEDMTLAELIEWYV